MLDGQPVTSIIVMRDVAVKEAGDRIQSAIDESGYVFPKKRVIISLALGDKKKRGSLREARASVGTIIFTFQQTFSANLYFLTIT